MKGHQKPIFAGLAALLLASLAGVILTHGWANYRERLRAIRRASDQPWQLVDTRELDTAQQAAQLAVSHTEQNYAQEALRLADRSVDLGFAAALEDATENAAPLTPQTRQLAARLKEAEAAVATDQDRVSRLTEQVAMGRDSEKDELQQELDVVQAELSLDKDELDDAHEDLIRAGGDKRATIQRLFEQHEASGQHNAETHASSGASATASSVEAAKSASVWAQLQAWRSLNAKGKLLQQARQNSLVRAAKLSTSHESLEAELNEEKSQKTILHKTAANVPSPGNAQPAGGSTEALSPLSLIRHLAQDQKNLAQLDKRIENEQQLAALYDNWITYVKVKKQAFVHGILLSVLWILLIALCVFVANEGVQRLFAQLKPERRQLHTMRAVILFAIQALGLVLILLVIFGMPNNFATVVALAGAGLTVALKDFIVGFFGWFVLMGKDGIRPGDWVEINGVGGEVLEVGLLHTVLLETGNWADAGHPTGRKVTFVNSFAIEGHYFNFSTSGQWLWDEIQLQIPESAEPYAVADAIQKIVADETAENARLAEQEWNRVTPSYARRTFSAAPSMSVRPTASGVNVLVRYITRVHERHEVRARLYRAIVELLHKKKIPQPAAAKPSPQSVADRT